MANTLVRDAVLISAIFAGGIYAFLNRDTIYEYAGIDPHTIAVARNNAKTKKLEITEPEQTASATMMGQTAVVSKSPDGQYWADASVNDMPVKFLVDTGASVVVLTPKDAKKAGIRLDNLTYNVAMNTAAGKIMAANTDIARIAVGDVILHNVRAVVIPRGLNQSLLGMSFLGELRKLEVTPEELILRQ